MAVEKKEIKDVIRDFVFGMEDGLVSNLGLVLGVYVGGGGTFAVVLAGLASMIAGAFSMSAGSYLSAKAQREVYEQEIAATKAELEKNPEQCIRDVREILKREGLGKKEIDAIVKKSPRYKHPQFVCNYLIQKKVGISQERLEVPLKNALAMFFSFLVGSLFPVVPFMILSNTTAVLTAIILTILVLFLVGSAKTLYTKRNWFKSGIEIVLVGLGAGVLGYLVGFVIRMFG